MGLGVSVGSPGCPGIHRDHLPLLPKCWVKACATVWRETILMRRQHPPEAVSELRLLLSGLLFKLGLLTVSFNFRQVAVQSSGVVRRCGAHPGAGFILSLLNLELQSGFLLSYQSVHW